MTRERPRGLGWVPRAGGLVVLLALSGVAHAQPLGPTGWTAPSQSPVPPQAEPPPTPAPAMPATPSTAPAAAQLAHRTSFMLMPGVGFATFAVDGVPTESGVVLETTGEVRFTPRFGLRTRFAWGLTQWHRSKVLIDHAIDAGEWTAGAYASVGHWVVNPPELFILKFIPSFFAFVALGLGFAYSGVVFLLTPLAATSYLQLGVSAAAHAPLGNGLDLFVEGGLGSMTYWHPRSQFVRQAFGPVFGAGLALGRFSFGVYGMWSPPLLQSAPTAAPNVFATSVSVRYGY